MANAKEFGDYIKKLRESRGLSINQLALSSGVSAAHISRIERGLRDVPHPDFIKKLARGLKVPYEQLMKAAGYIDELGRVQQTDADEALRVFSQRLRELREQRGWTILQLASRVYPTTAQYIKRLEERPNGFPGVSTLHRLARALGVSAAYLIGDVADPNDSGPVDAWYQPKDLIQFLDESEVMYEGRPLDDEDKERIKSILAAVFLDAKERNKRKK
ncbi:MAG: helix-turn-helix domain-containing protein [Alicyclobacillus sp.]|nr:helix-turn-helix domain-containing protein [Alicyclobacillus sp.]